MTDPFRPLKDAFSRFATGVSLAGCAREGAPSVFITVNSFTSVSLNPPLVLWCIERKSLAFPHFMAASAYSISVLGADQQHLSQHFAAREPAPPDASAIETWVTGAPILKDALAAFDCKITNRHAAGDHVILVAEVQRFRAANGRPLLYFASRYATGPEAEE